MLRMLDDLGIRQHVLGLLSTTVVLYWVFLIDARPILRRQVSTFDFETYLVTFGYLSARKPSDQNRIQEIETALRKFQKMYRLNETGQADEATIALMRTPRCGNPDFPVSQDGPQQFDIAVGRRWRKLDLTYSFKNYGTKLTPAAIRASAREAFDRWSRFSTLRFQEVTGGGKRSDITISFYANDNKARHVSDGKGGTLAYGHFPPEGELYIDDAEDWTLMSSEGQNLVYAMTHEMGHLIGINHSTCVGAVMNAHAPKYDRLWRLDDDDILAVESMYGEIFDDQYANFIPALPIPQGEDPPNICLRGVDAVTNINGEIHIFKGKWVWRITPEGQIRFNGPVRIAELWNLLPANISKIDTVFQRSGNGRIVVFIDDWYYEFDSRNARNLWSSRPLYSLGFLDELKRLNTALFWPTNNLTYYTSGRSEWTATPAKLDISPSHPTGIKINRGIPVPYDTEFIDREGNGVIIKGLSFYTHHPNLEIWEVVQGRPLGELWAFCRDRQQSYLGRATSSTFSGEMLVTSMILAIAFCMFPLST